MSLILDGAGARIKPGRKVVIQRSVAMRKNSHGGPALLMYGVLIDRPLVK